MKVLIVDDEQPARDRLRTLLEDESGIEVVGEAANGEEALAACAALRPDTVLLDIRMPGMDGIEAAHHMNSLDSPPAVVFATAYDEYAIDAFEARAIGYVLKPVRRERLRGALEQAAKLSRETLAEVAVEQRSQEARRHVCASAHGELHLIPLDSIVACIADQKYVSVYHDDGEDLIDDSLKSLEAEFPERFVRIHRSALVALERIERLEKRADGKQHVVLRDEATAGDNALIASRRHLGELRRRLKES